MGGGDYRMEGLSRKEKGFIDVTTGGNSVVTAGGEGYKGTK